MMIFDHIGVVAADVGEACRQLGATIGAQETTARFDDETLGVSVQFMRDQSGMVYELIAPLDANSPVAKALASKTNLLNQVAYRTSSLESAGKSLRKSGSLPLGPAKPALAFGGAFVQFFYCPLGFVIELIEAPQFQHAFADFDRSGTVSPQSRDGDLSSKHKAGLSGSAQPA